MQSYGVRPTINETSVAKAMFVVLGCAAGAGQVVQPIRPSVIDGFPEVLRPDFTVPTFILLALVLIQSLFLSFEGKRSASWAVLGFGSLAVVLENVLVMNIWYQFDQWQSSWQTLAITTTLALALVYFGLRAAFAGKWWRVGGFAVAVMLFIVVLGVYVNYAESFYCERNAIHHPAD